MPVRRIIWTIFDRQDYNTGNRQQISMFWVLTKIYLSQMNGSLRLTLNDSPQRHRLIISSPEGWVVGLKESNS